jgi:tryptophan synthase alpha subunit
VIRIIATSLKPFSMLCRRAGADIIEVGMPFSDPMADGVSHPGLPVSGR